MKSTPEYVLKDTGSVMGDRGGGILSEKQARFCILSFLLKTLHIT